MSASRRVVVPGLVLLAGLTSACSGGSAGDGQVLDVLAAASLTESFTALAETFEKTHPGVEVRLVLESSASLATQVGEGAPADVLATADLTSMQQVVGGGDAESFDVFATNELVLVTPRDNPAGVAAFADLGRDDVEYVACVETAPCGAIAARLLAENNVAAAPRSLEVDVKAVLAKVTSDEADAGLVYATDAVAAGDAVRRLSVPGSEDALTSYAVTVVRQADDPVLAEEWVELVLSAAGQRVLSDAGFGAP